MTVKVDILTNNPQYLCITYFALFLVYSLYQGKVQSKALFWITFFNFLRLCIYLFFESEHCFPIGVFKINRIEESKVKFFSLNQHISFYLHFLIGTWRKFRFLITYLYSYNSFLNHPLAISRYKYVLYLSHHMSIISLSNF